MVYAFDYHGATAAIPELRELAVQLLKAGHKCHIISGVASMSDAAKALDDSYSWGIPWTGFHPVIIPGIPKPDGEIERQVGRLKADVMRQIGASILFDDNPHIVRAVRDVGLRAFQVAN